MAIDYCSGGYESVLPYCYTAYYRAVCSKCGAFFYECRAIFVFADYGTARVVDVGEDHAGATEYVIFQSDCVVDADVILDFDVVAYKDVVTNVDVLAE